MLLSFSLIASSVPCPQATWVDISHCGKVRLGTLVAYPVGIAGFVDRVALGPYAKLCTQKLEVNAQGRGNSFQGAAIEHGG